MERETPFQVRMHKSIYVSISMSLCMCVFLISVCAVLMTGLELALRHSSAGEKLRVRTTHKFAYGAAVVPAPAGGGRDIPAFSDLEFEVEVLEVRSQGWGGECTGRSSMECLCLPLCLCMHVSVCVCVGVSVCLRVSVCV